MKIHKRHTAEGFKTLDVLPHGGVAVLTPDGKMVAYSKVSRLWHWDKTFSADWDWVNARFRYTKKT
jgi:hypothetical protein